MFGAEGSQTNSQGGPGKSIKITGMSHPGSPGRIRRTKRQIPEKAQGCFQRAGKYEVESSPHSSIMRLKLNQPYSDTGTHDDHKSSSIQTHLTHLSYRDYKDVNTAQVGQKIRDRN